MLDPVQRTAPQGGGVEEGPGDTGTRGPSKKGVAILLASAALVAAVLAARASFLAGNASDSWQQAVRAEVKRSAATVEDVRFVYSVEAEQAVRVMTALTRSEELKRQAQRLTGTPRDAVLAEAEAEDLLAGTLVNASDIAKDPRYATPDGGFDLGRRLADVRNKNADLVAIDPDAFQGAGDHARDRAFHEILATVPVAIAFLFGALSQGVPRRRRAFLILGSGFLVVAVVAGVVLEVVG